jgi:Mn-dependent DtxR family transcriptional regulator
MPTGTCRKLRTIAEKLRISDHDAERIANDCQARGWVEFKHGSVRLEEEGRRQVA